MSLFFADKSFHSRISFSSNIIFYEFTRERLQVAKAENIAEIMKNILKFMKDKLEKARERMIAQVNKHRKKIFYQKDDKMFLNRHNIKTARSSDKLGDKNLDSYEILERKDNAYKLKLLDTMRIHDDFHSWLLRKDSQDFLP